MSFIQVLLLFTSVLLACNNVSKEPPLDEMTPESDQRPSKLYKLGEENFEGILTFVSEVDEYRKAKELYEKCQLLRENLKNRGAIDKLVKEAKELRFGDYGYIAFAAGYISALSNELKWQGNLTSPDAESFKSEYERLMSKSRDVLEAKRKELESIPK